MVEDKNKDYKSLRKVFGKQADLKSLAETCVCFANAQGGEIIIGIEDKESEPPSKQKIDQEAANKVIKQLRDLTDGVGIVNQDIIKHKNGFIPEIPDQANDDIRFVSLRIDRRRQ